MSLTSYRTAPPRGKRFHPNGFGADKVPGRDAARDDAWRQWEDHRESTFRPRCACRFFRTALSLQEPGDDLLSHAFKKQYHRR